MEIREQSVIFLVFYYVILNCCESSRIIIVEDAKGNIYLFLTIKLL